MCEGIKLDFTLLKKLAKDARSKSKIDEIAKDHYDVFQKGKFPKGNNIFSIVLNNHWSCAKND
jgi:hypothetical protein